LSPWHSHASAPIVAGVDVLTVSRRLGHGSPVVTSNTYAHLLEKTDTKAASAIEAAFARVLDVVGRSGANPAPVSGFVLDACLPSA